MPISDALLVTEIEAHIELWEMNREDSRNPISKPDMVDAIVKNVERVNQDTQVRAVILTGKGQAFSAGGNVKDMAHKTGMFSGSPYELREGYRRGIQRIPMALYNCEVPVIAAINGPAVGAGTDLALMCDLRVFSEKAWLAESFVSLGIIPGDGGAWLLARNLSPARAAEMVLTGDRIDAHLAKKWGLTNAVVPPEELMDASVNLARRVAKNPPHSVRMAKRLLRESQQQPLSNVLELSAAMQAISHHTADHDEALDAMLNNRDGNYKGR